jgi:hypothetical protein
MATHDTTHTIQTEINTTRVSIEVEYNHPHHLQCLPCARRRQNITIIAVAIDRMNTKGTTTTVDAIRHSAVAAVTVTAVKM